jgi:hypothetical protein
VVGGGESRAELVGGQGLENSETIMEQEINEKSCKQFMVLADNASADLLPSTKSCEVTRSDHRLQDPTSNNILIGSSQYPLSLNIDGMTLFR